MHTYFTQLALDKVFFTKTNDRAGKSGEQYKTARMHCMLFHSPQKNPRTRRQNKGDILYFMCLFWEMLRVKNCRISSGWKYFPITANISPCPTWNYFFCCTAFVHKIIRGNIIYNLFYQLVVNMRKYLPQKGKVRENNSCRKAVRHELFSRTFPFWGKYFPLLTTSWWNKHYVLFHTCKRTTLSLHRAHFKIMLWTIFFCKNDSDYFTRHNSAYSLATSNLVCIQEVAIRTTFSQLE